MKILASVAVATALFVYITYQKKKCYVEHVLPETTHLTSTKKYISF
jgi:hypothetical protein